MTHRFGRFSGAGIAADPIIGTLILATLIAIPIAGTLAALGFLASGLILMALHPGETLRLVRRFWPIVALAGFCTLSLFWSAEPGASLRFGLQLGATVMIALILARRLSLAQCLTVIFWVLACVTALSILVGNYRSDTGALTGFYASKNAMGGAAAILALIAIGFARSGPWAWRLTAIGVAAMALLAILLAQSVSALLGLAMALAAVIAIQILRPLPQLMRYGLGLFLGLAGVLAMILAVANFEAVSDMVLALTGKDVTLTGRTDLWLVALAEIAERPFTGLGYQAFWVEGNPSAELLWAHFGIASRSGFHFHNTYLSNAVEIGIPGMLLQTGIIFACVLATARAALRHRSRETDILFGLVAMIFVLTPVEVPVFFQFNLTTLILVSALVYARDALKAGFDQRGLSHPVAKAHSAYPARPLMQSQEGSAAG